MNGTQPAPHVPDQQTLTLLNTYIVTMATMLNDFHVSCERQLSQVSQGCLRTCLRMRLLVVSSCVFSFIVGIRAGADEPEGS